MSQKPTQRTAAPVVGRLPVTSARHQQLQPDQQPAAAPTGQLGTQPNWNTEALKNPTLPTDIASLGPYTGRTIPFLGSHPVIRFSADVRLPYPPLPTTKSAGANPNNILVILPTADASVARLIAAHLTREASKAPHIKLCHFLTVPAEPGVGAQPYDAAGAAGAENRVRNAVDKLASAEFGPRVRDLLARHSIGTLLVGTVESFVKRQKMGYTARCRGRGGGAQQRPTTPTEYGIIALCRVPLMSGLGAGAWEWKVGVSNGVVVPAEYWRFAETFGFDDGAGRSHGRVALGRVLAANVPGLDPADWHRVLAGKSKYDIWEEAMSTMEVPWPKARESLAPHVAEGEAARSCQ